MPDVLSFLSCPERFKRKGPHEWAGPCPGCGGNDRFLVWPERPRGGAYLCRGCGASGDGIQYLREFRGMSYPEACAALGLTPKDSRASFLAGGTSSRHAGTRQGQGRDSGTSRDTGTVPAQYRHPAAEQVAPPWPPPPAPAELPPAAWSHAAAAFLADCQRGLETNVEAVLALTGRYLTPDTAHACGLGWNPADRYEHRETWSLSPVEGREKLLLPRGLVIATRRRSGVVAVTVRCPDDRPEGRPKYRQIAGSANVPFVVGRSGLPVVLMESALDAALLWAETVGQCAAVAFMGSSKPVDADTAAFIAAAPLIIAAPDNDDAGKKAWQRWSRAFPSAVCVPAVGAKDLGDMHRAALTPPLREEVPTSGEWFTAALEYAAKSRGTAPESSESAKDHQQPPREKLSRRRPHNERRLAH